MVYISKNKAISDNIGSLYMVILNASYQVRFLKLQLFFKLNYISYNVQRGETDTVHLSHPE